MISAPNTAFVLPIGMSLGGVSIWSTEMCRSLLEADCPAVIVKHASIRNRPGLKVPEAVPIINCPGVPAVAASLRDLRHYVSTYESVLPATLIPNWSAETYATCALLTQRRQQDIRIIGFVHADEKDYYDWMIYYEPIIQIFVAVSEESGRKLEAILPQRRSDIMVRPYGVKVDQVYSRLYWSHDPIRIVFAGRLQDEQKRISDIPRLIELLEIKNINYTFHIIGDGPQKNWLDARIRQLPYNLTSKITLKGAVPHEFMSDIWKNSDICMLFSEYEGTSISMLEAMAEGCVPVITRVSGAETVIRDGENGFCVNIGDMEMMSQIIRTLSEHKHEFQRLSVNAHATIRDNFAIHDYLVWFRALIDLAWQRPSAQWPMNRPVLPYARYHKTRETVMRVSRYLGRQWNRLLTPAGHC